VQLGALILDGEVCAFDANLVSHIYLGDQPPITGLITGATREYDCKYGRCE